MKIFKKIVSSAVVLAVAMGAVSVSAQETIETEPATAQMPDAVQIPETAPAVGADEETTETTVTAVSETESAASVSSDVTSVTTAQPAPVTSKTKPVVTADTGTADKWTGGSYSKTIDLTAYGHDIGAFIDLYFMGQPVDTKFYSYVQNGIKSIVITLNEACRNRLGNGSYVFDVHMSGADIIPAFAVRIESPSVSTSAVTASFVTSSSSGAGGNSPKTGSETSGTAAAAGVLALSAAAGIGAKLAGRRKK